MDAIAPLFAEMDADLKGALVGFLVVLTLVLQSLYADWRAKKVAKDLKADAAETARLKAEADEKAEAEKAAAIKRALDEAAAKLAAKTEQTAAVVAEKLETVHKAVNGEGLGGKLDAVLRWQIEHDAQDNQRYDGLVAEILKLKGGRTPAGG
jgi:hypothetical protein